MLHELHEVSALVINFSCGNISMGLHISEEMVAGEKGSATVLKLRPILHCEVYPHQPSVLVVVLRPKSPFYFEHGCGTSFPCRHFF